MIENADPEPVGFVDQIEQVLPRQRIAAGENQLRQRLAELDKLTQKRDTLVESQLAGFGSGCASARQWRRPARRLAWFPSKR